MIELLTSPAAINAAAAASGVLFGMAAGRVCWPWTGRRGGRAESAPRADAPPAVPSPPTGVRGAGVVESATESGPVDGAQGGLDAAPERPRHDRPRPAVAGSDRVKVIYSAAEQAREFLAWWQRDSIPGIYTHTVVLTEYRAWARKRAVELASEQEFLTALAALPGVDKTRRRVKDAMGRVLRNEADTPHRVTCYRIPPLPDELPAPRTIAPDRIGREGSPRRAAQPQRRAA